MAAAWSRAGVRRDIVRLIFEEWFGLCPSLADLLLAMFEAGGEQRRYSDLAILMNSHRPIKRNALEVRICALRRALESEAVDTGPGGTYGLTEIGMAECRQAIREMGGVLRAFCDEAA